jgi:hypothetical protein
MGSSRQDRAEPSDDPSAAYGANNYGQRPHTRAGDFFATTGRPHRRRERQARRLPQRQGRGRFAAKNKLGGDFEPRVWAANSARVVLTRVPARSYGERPATPEGPAEPTAGRTQRRRKPALIPDWQKAPLADGKPPARDTNRRAGAGQPKTAEALYGQKIASICRAWV